MLYKIGAFENNPTPNQSIKTQYLWNSLSTQFHEGLKQGKFWLASLLLLLNEVIKVSRDVINRTD